MKIAILGPSPIPYTMGGAENLYLGLAGAFAEHTPHQVELIKVPVRETGFWEIIDSYHQFYRMDLSQFDAVMCCKYPAWMVQHPNCLYYVLHRLRGLYDTYPPMLPLEVDGGDRLVDKVLAYMETNRQPKRLDGFFALLEELRDNKGAIAPGYFNFPGPLIRKIVHYMDDFGMQQNGGAPCYAISHTVKGRKAYFPKDAEIETVYPPPYRVDTTPGDFKHLFVVSRLDGPKRLDLLLRAMTHVKSDVKLYIAGTGPDESKLKALARDDPRIVFLGYVGDDEVHRYYADSLAVPYFPFEEDLGLITIEAMLHHKPVITTVDAGGPTEFVLEGDTGFVVKPEPQAIAEKIDLLAGDPALAREMGERAFGRAKDISWQNTANALEQAIAGQSEQREKKWGKITVTSSFPIWPPRGGGQARIFGLYRDIAKKYDVEIVGFPANAEAFDSMIAPGLREVRIPKSEAHLQHEAEFRKCCRFPPIEDIAMLLYAQDTPGYGRALEESVRQSRLVVVSHPYMWNEVKRYIGDKPFVYEAHNVESVMKEAALPPSPCKKQAIDAVFEAEKECCQRSEFIMVCTWEDADKLAELYGIPKEKCVLVPNGVGVDDTPYTLPERRFANKVYMGLEGERLALFVGSWHAPNLEACEEIIRMALLCTDTKFLLMGSQCGYFEEQVSRGRVLPDNVGLLGIVSDEQKHRILAAADIALNPMLSGSGTNLKMFEYMAAGLPVITSAFGTRGIDRKDLFIVAEPGPEMAEAINAFEPEKAGQMVQAARRYVRETFDWSAIARKLVERLEHM